jgi:hypothetical protein
MQGWWTMTLPRLGAAWLGALVPFVVLADDDEVEMLAGSPPMVSDDTGTPGAGNIELNLVVNAERDRDGESFDAPLIDLNFGIGERVQLKFEVPYQIEHEDAVDGERSRTVRGIGASELGLKYRFYDADGTALALYPQYAFRTPGGLHDQPATWILPLLFNHEWERAALTANVGYEKARGERGNTFASVAVGTRVSPRDALLLELAARELGDHDARAVALDVGWRHQLDEKHAWLFAIGRDIAGAGNDHDHYLATVAFQILIGDE